MNNPYLAQFNILKNRGWDARDRWVKEYAWAIPNDEAIATIARHTPRVVEIGAGTGYWACMLAQAGVNVVAYDLKPHNNYWCAGNYYPVQYGGAARAARHPDRALMLCWPRYNNNFALRALKAYQGDTLIYVGEGYRGCCANDAFFHRLGREWNLADEVDIPTWDSLHDYLAIYRRVK